MANSMDIPPAAYPGARMAEMCCLGRLIVLNIWVIPLAVACRRFTALGGDIMEPFDLQLFMEFNAATGSEATRVRATGRVAQTDSALNAGGYRSQIERLCAVAAGADRGKRPDCDLGNTPDTLNITAIHRRPCRSAYQRAHGPRGQQAGKDQRFLGFGERRRCRVAPVQCMVMVLRAFSAEKGMRIS